MSTYVDKVGPLIANVPSIMRADIRIAQHLIETGYGSSPLFKLSNNGFGIKAKDDDVSTKWWNKEDVINLQSPEVDGLQYSNFRSYSMFEKSILDHANFFTSTDFRTGYYRKAYEAQTFEEAAKALTGTYAGDPLYGDKLMRANKAHRLTERFGPKGEKMTILLIAGHGKNPNNNYFDPGATGYITEGEHRYMRDTLFPAMKKYSGDKIKYFSDYNVYSAGNLVSLAKSYGSNTVVVEMHYDATGNNVSSGGHVIIYGDFTPDKIDLALRDAIAKNVGLAYPIHKGHKGISGRKDLRNPNLAANGGINYRLLELGFGTNKKDADYMKNQVERYAKDLVEALIGEVKLSDDMNQNIPDPRMVELPSYREPVKTYSVLQGETKDVIEGLNFWYRPQSKDGYKPSVDVDNQEVTIIRGIDIDPVSFSKRAYLIEEYNSWVLEENLQGAKQLWDKEESDIQEKGQDYLFWQGRKYEIGNEIQD